VTKLTMLTKLTRQWKFWLGILISILALYFTLRGIHFDELLATLAQAQILWLIPATLFLLLTLAVRTLRWASLMDGTPFGVTLHALNIGYMLNMLLPFRLGEIGRAYVIGERTPVRMTRALSTVVVERMLDLGAVVILFALLTQFIPIPASFSGAALAGGLLLILLVVVFAVVIWQAARVERWLDGLLRRMPGVHPEMWLRRFRDLVGGFQIIRTPRKLALSILFTALIWALQLVVTVIIMQAFMPARFDKAFSVLILSNLGGALPSAPGGLGVVQFFAKQSLVIPFNVAEDVAVAYAFVLSLYQEFVLILLGFWGLVRVGLTFASITASSQQSTVKEAPGGQQTSARK
jgi:uncharacterized protein (TIRG00374 family)